MGKHEVGTPKYIANKIKSKGLQKLRWFCQMCQKQCRDENGFKCHTLSESHQRQLLMFADNPHKYMNEFSTEFSEGYLGLLKRQFGTKRVPANRVYQEYIADRTHVHMNATNWLSLTAFVKWLGKTGKCVVDETEKGWFVTYIDRDPEALAQQEKKQKKEKLDKDDEERMIEFIQKQVERGKQEGHSSQDTELAPLYRPEDDTPLVLEMKIKPKVKPLPILNPKAKLTDSGDEDGEGKESRKRKKDKDESGKKKIKKEKDDEKEKRNGSEKEKRNGSEKERGWLRESIVVKIVTKRMGEKYYKAKGTILELVDKDCFVGKIKICSPEEVKGHVIKIDQEYLETVIPVVGKEVLILKGSHEGEIGTVKKVRIEEYCIDVKIDDDVVKRLPYEDVCKIER